MTFNVKLLAIIAIAFGLSAAAAYRVQPSCEDKEAVRRVTSQFRIDQHLDGVMISDVEKLSGGPFGPLTCHLLVTELRGNVDLADRAWTAIQYHSPSAGQFYTVTGTAKPPTKDF